MEIGFEAIALSIAIVYLFDFWIYFRMTGSIKGYIGGWKKDIRKLIS